MAKNGKEEIAPIIYTEQQKEIIEKVKAFIGTPNIDISKLKLHKDSIDDYYSIVYNFMGTGIHVPADEIDEFEFTKNGIGIWKTTTYNN